MKPFQLHALRCLASPWMETALFGKRQDPAIRLPFTVVVQLFLPQYLKLKLEFAKLIAPCIDYFASDLSAGCCDVDVVFEIIGLREL